TTATPRMSAPIRSSPLPPTRLPASGVVGAGSPYVVGFTPIGANPCWARAKLVLKSFCASLICCTLRYADVAAPTAWLMSVIQELGAGLEEVAEVSADGGGALEASFTAEDTESGIVVRSIPSHASSPNPSNRCGGP